MIGKLLLLVIIFFTGSILLVAQPIKIATYQYADNNRIQNIQPFAEHIKKKYGLETIVKSYPTVHAFISSIQKGEVDIALINTFGYLILETSDKKYPMKPVLTLNVKEDARDNYKTAFITASNSPVKGMADIKKISNQIRLVLVAEGSTSGNLVPRLALSGSGIINPEKEFASLQYAGNHSLAIEKILNNQADLACMGYTEYEKAINDSSKKSKIKLIWLSPEIPLGPVLIHEKIDSSGKAIIEKAFFDLHIENAAAIESIKAGWSEAKQANYYIKITDSYYNSFRNTFGKKKDMQRILRQFAN